MNVLVIGGGNMGMTYAAAIATSNFLTDGSLMIFDKSEEKLNELRSKGLFDVHDQLATCLPKADVVLIAVKPVHAPGLMAEMKPMVSDEQLFVSIMAGVTIKTIRKGLGVGKVVRAMPNLPALVGLGMTSFTASEQVSRLELAAIERLLDTTGRSIMLPSESKIDASTGISGSGPAYIFYFMQALMDAATKMGFLEADARLLVSQTFAGAVELFNSSALSPEDWMAKVASKGGTTRAALDSMDGNNVNALIQEAAYAAFRRAEELGKQSEGKEVSHA
ncbi:pyrroline-5-carboxylate reductase [Parapedobacter pyrenivorans]|uniref:Pyrroline-5-carboxylate reductase n=1 Tax=Parapedobacter pyrenivorans TaxID=1305674 RepID=A0A917I2Y7_9SPHI|nr:pyrroline-5-carboxylate reductase [Parapedobacter pyrenivorans]GGH03997.1 pyrroline-5-carboxylate reductase [Parapedobacter pyrenivorans]